MAVPFSGFVVPDLPYLVLLGIGTLAVGALLVFFRPPVTQGTVLAVVPWVANGAALHVFYLLGRAYGVRVYPPVVEPLFGAPAVYVTVFVVAGGIWVLAVLLGQGTATGLTPAQFLGGTGVGVLATLVALLAWQALDPAVGPVRVILPVVGIILSGAITFVAYMVVGAWRTRIIAGARLSGALVLFAHVLDGVTTAIGADVLGVGERSYLPRRIMEFAADLPTEPYLGVGWLFLLVKMVVAIAVIAAFADYVREHPSRANLLYAVVMAVGLGPAMNNIFVFALGL